MTSRKPQFYYRLSAVLFALGVACVLFGSAGCGAASTDLVRPAYVGTIEACRQRQESAIEHADTRNEAEARVADIRRRCDIAYSGLEAAAAILDETLPEDTHE